MLHSLCRWATLAAAGALAAAPLAAAAQSAAPAVPVSIQMARIDTNCLVTQKVTTQYPAALVINKSTVKTAATQWQQVNADTYARAVGAAPTITTAKVWKQAGKLTWVQTLRKRPTNSLVSDYCFRYSGTLARVHVHLANAADTAHASETVWLDDGGNVIAKKNTLKVGDPPLFPRVTDLPFYAVILQTRPASSMSGGSMSGHPMSAPSPSAT